MNCEALRQAGHTVLVESHAGDGSGALDADYRAVGAKLLRSFYRPANMIVKVKEPQPTELKQLRPGQILFTYFHFAADKKLFNAALRSGIVAIAYEAIQSSDGTLPLLTSMKGRGLLLAGVPG